MEYCKKELGSYNIHFIQSTSFKTTTIRVFFRLPMTKENITKHNLLNRLLVLSCNKYRTKVELSKACQDCYGASINASLRRIGTYLCSVYTLKVLDDKYSEKGNLQKSLTLFHDVLFDPKVEKEAFYEEDFLPLYQEYKTNLESLEEEKSRYALIRLLENVGPKGTFAIRSVGYLEELEKVTKENLYQYYKEMIDHSIVDIFLLGNIEEEEGLTLIKEAFPITTFKAKRQNLFAPRIVPRLRRKVVREKTSGSQTCCAIALTIDDPEEKKTDYALTLYNIMLGAGMDSLLFTEVREKHSLAYYISSTVNRFDHLILISAGIDKEKEEQCVQIIKKQLKRLKEGKFEDKLLEHAKEYYLSAIDEIEESTFQIIDTYYMKELTEGDDLETRKKKIKKITKEEIMKVGEKISFHTTYFLEGEEE